MSATGERSDPRTVNGWWIMRVTPDGDFWSRPAVVVVRDGWLTCTDELDGRVFRARARDLSVRVASSGTVRVTSAGTRLVIRTPRHLERERWWPLLCRGPPDVPGGDLGRLAGTPSRRTVADSSGRVAQVLAVNGAQLARVRRYSPLRAALAPW